MEVRRDVLLGVITLVVFYIALSFAAVGLQQRLEPTVNTIEERNVVSIISALEVLATLDSGDALAIRSLAERIQNNETEDGEREIAERVWNIAQTPVYKGTDEYDQLVGDLEAIVTINREATLRHSQQAFRLAQGGAWVLITLVAFGLWGSWFIVRRLQRRIVLPLERLAETMAHGRSGTTRVRAYAQGAAYEIREAANALNALLDNRAMHYERRRKSISRPERDIVVALMENVPSPAWIVNEDGEIRAANQRGMETQQGSAGRRIKAFLRQTISQKQRGEQTQSLDQAFEVVGLGDEDHFLCILLEPCTFDVDAQD